MTRACGSVRAICPYMQIVLKYYVHVMLYLMNWYDYDMIC